MSATPKKPSGPSSDVSLPVGGQFVLQNRFSVWTDKPTYVIGETVQIHVSPVPGIGVGFWLLIYAPDGSQMRISLRQGQDTVAIQGGPLLGQYEVQLWSRVVVPKSTPRLDTYCRFQVTALR